MPRGVPPLLLMVVGTMAALVHADRVEQRGRPPREVILEIHDRAGGRLGWDAFRHRQENGRGEAGDNDVLLDPRDLTVIEAGPLYSANGKGDGDPAVEWPGRPAALALAWPTSHGYSNLIVDLPGPGRYDLGLLAAQQAGAALERALAARPDYRPSAAFRRARERTRALLDEARKADRRRRGALGAQALDEAVGATLRLLTECGIQRARRVGSGDLQWGFTLDSVKDARRLLTSVAELAPGNGWVRIVFDRAEPPESYRAAVDLAHTLGVRVVGQILDSSQMKGVSLAAWRDRVNRYVTALPAVDEWEVGNEVNGTWLGPDVVAKVAYAARYLREHTRARTLLTLYWQLGEEEPRSSMFEWASHNLSSELLRDIDDIGISLYPEDHPMGLAMNRVFATLHARFPSQRLLISELGYWSADLGHTWWWGSRSNPTDRGRAAVASLYQSAILGFPYSGGGTYWWYYRQEALGPTPLRRTLAALHARATGGRSAG
jgi:hypothetical protein